mgnify:FL=1
MKKISIETKKTGANTQYYRFSSREEKNWLIGTMAYVKYAEKMCDDPELLTRLMKQHKDFGSHYPVNGNKTGNSMWRAWSGILEQHFRDSDKDISRPQLKFVESIMNELNTPIQWSIDQPVAKNEFNNVFSFAK